MFPQALQVRREGVCPIAGRTGAEVIYTGVEGEGAGGTACPARVPQIPQNFSEGVTGEPHDIQSNGATG